MLKEKAEKLHLNQMPNKSTPKGANVIFELQVKQDEKRGFKSKAQLIESILTIGKEHCKAAAIVVTCMITDITLKISQKEIVGKFFKYFLETSRIVALMLLLNNNGKNNNSEKSI